MDDRQRRTELAAFLRSRRERLSPRQLGMPLAGRRRTPGLRREELAALAGVGTTWYTWLEQGRQITVSAQVLDSLARALQLDAAERAHLFLLARGEVPAILAPTTEAVEGAVQQLLDALLPNPAYIVNARWKVVAWNEAACRVFIDFAALAERDRNLIWLLFTHPALRQLYVDWAGVARRMLALFRVSTTASVGERWFTDLIDELSLVSPEFREWWPRHDIAGAPREAKELNHPQVGRLVLHSNPLQLGLLSDSWLLAYTPMLETDTAARLERLMFKIGAENAV